MRAEQKKATDAALALRNAQLRAHEECFIQKP